MKKNIALMLALLMMASLTACSSSSDSTSDTTAAETVAETDSETTAAETEAAEIEVSEETTAAESAAAEDSDLVYIQEKGTLVVGITDFEPMDYKDADGNWIGFDADMATAFAESLGVEVEFVEIDWDNKILELDGKTIDCVWNGMTLTSEVTSSMDCSNAYCNNAQVLIVSSDVADQYQDTDSLADLTIAVEAGSAGEEVVTELGIATTAVSSQADALMEIAAGTSDAAVIDALMAAAMVGEGTGYEDLTYTISLNSEEYGVGFRIGSDLVELLNEFFATSYADGSMLEIAETYGVQAALIEQ
ncbi:MAG: transporter substrate-binding domain-containing protein [Lachnospiraceae bacterium]|nr:transporter substrate-binding domain-containing protein [Lachnospiraceae bacterium]